MFDEVLKYGSLIVDAFVAYEQPVFIFIPPFAEVRGGAWVVLDASINANVMEMYASSGTARGGVLEANGAASVKYREKDLLKTMDRLDGKLISLKEKLSKIGIDSNEAAEIKKEIETRQKSLLPVYAQIAVQFCELHDTPGRMKATGVIEKEVEWTQSRSFFFWRLRRKLAEFDFRKNIVEASNVGRGISKLPPLKASGMIKEWFLQSTGVSQQDWSDDKKVLEWMGNSHYELEGKVLDLTKKYVADEVILAMTASGNTAKIGSAGIIDGITKACAEMDAVRQEEFKEALKKSLKL